MRRSNVLFLGLILVVMAALFVAFVGTVRNEAARSKCSNNLKQLALALDSYHAQNMRFPAGTVPHPHLTPEKRLSWHVDLWGYTVGGIGLLLDRARAWDAPENLPVRVRYKFGGEDTLDSNRWLLCPGNPNDGLQDSLGVVHYLGIAGVGEDSPNLPISEQPDDQRRLGIVSYDRYTRRSDVTDGASNTITLVETALDIGPWTAGGPPTVRGINQAIQPYLGPGRQFGGSHPGGTMAGLLDGSTRFLSNQTSPQVFEALATIAGGEKVSAGDYEH